MQSSLGSSPVNGALLYDTFPHDASNYHMSLENRRRLPRRSGSQRAVGSGGAAAMRIVKPNYTSNTTNSSPRSKGTRGRSTTSSEYSALRRQQALEQLTNEGYRQRLSSNGSRSSRPLSWHPHSLHQPQWYSQPPTASLQCQASYHDNATPSRLFPDQADGSFFMQPYYSPNMAAHSTDTSPCSTFLSFPPQMSSQYPTPGSATSPLPYLDHASLQPLFTPYQHPSQPAHQQQSQHTEAGRHHSFEDWQSLSQPPQQQQQQQWQQHQQPQWDAGYMSVPMLNMTTPPTPTHGPHIPEPRAAGSTASQNHHEHGSSDHSSVEDEGEVLVGMGLYDTPEKAQDDNDPHLERYRSTVTSLFGSAFRQAGHHHHQYHQHQQESTGKGLMLEETWEPPTSDDDGNDDQDGEGEPDD